MSARINRSAVFAAAVFTLVACRGGDATGTRELPGCTGPVSISVTAGTSPRFSWTPACKVYYLHVGGEGTGEQMWSIANFNEQNTISPGVKFGVVPDDTRGIDGPLPL
ncbi:MAG: hypothetical protein ABIW94_06805, partial [Gemmatimonadaceae bacterium]